MNIYNYITQFNLFNNLAVTDLNYSSVFKTLNSYIFVDGDDLKQVDWIKRHEFNLLTVPQLVNNQAKKEKTAFVVTGAIGSGKSVFIRELYKQAIISPNVEFLCEDLYKKKFFDDAPSLKIAYLQSKIYLNYKIEKKVADGDDFVIELVPSASYRLKLLHDLRDYGYRICLFHIMTEYAAINAERVTARIRSGGDYIKHEKVISRYNIVNKNLRQLFQYSNEIYIFDSVNGEFKFVAFGNGEEFSVVKRCDYVLDEISRINPKINFI